MYTTFLYRIVSSLWESKDYGAQWLRGRASDSRLGEPGFESWASLFTVHCYINEYQAIDSGGYVYEQPSRINCSIWLDASQIN